MKRFLLLPLIAFAALFTWAFAFMADQATAAYDHIKVAAAATIRGVTAVVKSGLSLFAASEPARTDGIPMVQAKAFEQRLSKRERPVLTASWRMCPSI